jgi:NAD(P)-dependent dehydrogenase (short-subunit alcohol dehydrogenase family)
MNIANVKDSERPHMVVIASPATYFGVAVSATKVAVVALLENLRSELAFQNIACVSIIAPGFVKTRIVKR